MSNSSIMSVREMIDTAFGEDDKNVVNFKLIQTVLYLLARQLRVLERRVEIVIPADLYASSTSLSVTEVKMQANVPKKKRKSMKVVPGRTGATGGGRGPLGPGAAVGMRGTKGAVVSVGGGRTEKSGGRANAITKVVDSVGAQGGKGIEKDTIGSEIAEKKSLISETESSAADRTTTDKTSTAKSSSSKSKSTTDKTSSDKTSTDKTSATKSTTDKTSTTDKSSPTKSTTDKTSTEPTSTKTPTEMSSTDPTTSTKPSTDKSSTDKSSTKTSADPTTTSDKTTTEVTSVTKSSTDKSSTEKTSTVKSSSDKTSTEETSTTKSSTDKTSTEKSTTITSSSAKTSTVPTSKSSTDKTSTEKSTTITSSSAKTSTVPTSEKTTSKSTTDKTSTKETTSRSTASKGTDLWRFLDTFEQERERELRVIRQRKDSREDPERSPSPIASADSMEVQYEKLLVVERTPLSEAAAATSREESRAPRLSVVTQDQFAKLIAEVQKLQAKLGPIATPGFAENAKLMEDLRRGASLTDAMAALQLSARVEAAEKTLQQMLSLVTELAKRTPGVDLSGTAYAGKLGQATGPTSQMPPRISHRTAAFEQPPLKVVSSTESQSESIGSQTEVLGPPTRTAEATTGLAPVPLPQSTLQIEETVALEPLVAQETQAPPDWITIDELDEAMEELYDKVLKTINGITTRTTVNADTALKTVNRLESKLTASLNLDNRMEDLEVAVNEYAEKINILDTGLSSQMTYFQEQLTQMQYDLDTGLETMAESLANAGGDTTAVAELNAHFTSLQIDFDNTTTRQKELHNIQKELSMDLRDLWKQIELLKATKSDRDEVADALRDKAGIGALNGIISQSQFDAVRGDFEKRIGSAYEKFNNQEIVWQKVIDELQRQLTEKANLVQVLGLRNDINKNLDILKGRLHAMMEIVGEPRAAAIARKIHREAACLSCATPAHMQLEEPGIVPALPAFGAVRPPTIGAEATGPTKEEKERICYPGHPIPHPPDPRSHICNRYCGGSHTLLPSSLSRAPAGMIISNMDRKIATEVGTDGKTYLIDERFKKRPCLPCNLSRNTNSPQASKRASAADTAPDINECAAETARSENVSAEVPSAALRPSIVSVTPPLPLYED